MDNDESAEPYRGFLRSGSYPALTKRIVTSGGLLVRAAGWFALVVTAASAGYNMTQRVVSRSSAALRPQVVAQQAAGQVELAADLQALQLPTGHVEEAPPHEPKEMRTSLAASRQRVVVADKERSGGATKRKQSETGAIAAVSHSHSTLHGEAAQPDQTVKEPELQTSKEAAAALEPAAVSGEAPTLSERRSPFTRTATTFVRAALVQPPSAAAVKPVAAARQPVALPLAATARIDDLAVKGSVSSANVRHGLERVQPTLTECYASAARLAGENRFSQVHVVVQIDEAGRVKTQPTVEGAQLPGLDACLRSAFSKLVCRAPDTGTAKASITLHFGPLALAANRVETR